jgi:Arc/MetJ-type ribon-helix-helix transcriptional regulator
MKLSVSMSDADVAFVDTYAAAHGVASRSGVLHEALGLLRNQELAADYASAWDEWADDADNAVWESASADGLEPAADAQR